MNRSVERGKRGEREIVALLASLTNWPVRRALGTGRHEDCGDVVGLPSTCAQVKSYSDTSRALREALSELPRQQQNAGAEYGVAFIRRHGGEWIAAMTVEQFVAILREATRPEGE